MYFVIASATAQEKINNQNPINYRMIGIVNFLAFTMTQKWDNSFCLLFLYTLRIKASIKRHIETIYFGFFLLHFSYTYVLNQRTALLIYFIF